MATLSWAHEYAEVRRKLGRPREQRPNADDIVSELFAANQHMLNRQTNTKRVWSRNIATVTTVADQAEYDLELAEGAVDSFGKAYFAYRDHGEGVIVPIPIADMGNEIPNQSYEFRVVPPEASVIPEFYNLSSVKMAVYRHLGTPKARIFPVPTEADIEYSIFYSTGRLDADDYQITDEPPNQEHTRLRVVMAALALIDRTEWDGLEAGERAQQERRNAMRAGLEKEYTLADAEFDMWIRQTVHDPYDQVGPWYE